MIVIIDSCSGSASLGSGVSCAASMTTWVDQLPRPPGSKTNWPTATSRVSPPGVNLALADADQAARIVAEFPLAAAGLITAGVIPPLPTGL